MNTKITTSNSEELKDINLAVKSNNFPFNLYLAKNNPKNLSKNSKFTENTSFTNLISKLEDFLPKIAVSNEELLSLPQNEVNLEQVEDQDQFIEMNLQLYEDSSNSECSCEEGNFLNLQTKVSPEHSQKPLIIEEDTTTPH